MYISNAVMPETSEKNGGGAVVIDGHKLPYPVGIGLNDLPNISCQVQKSLNRQTMPGSSF